MSCPVSPRTRMRPIGPSVPMNVLPPRVSLAGGQSDRSGRCPSRVWITKIPVSRAFASTRWVGSTALSSKDVSLPRASPKPPGNTKSRCMSMITSAVVAGLKSRSNGSAAIVAMSPPVGQHEARRPRAGRSATGLLPPALNDQRSAYNCVHTVDAENSPELGDDRVGVAAEVGELVVEGLGVGAGDVGPAETDDEVGDALVLEAAHAVEGIGAGRDHVHLERPVRGALLGAEAGQAFQ